MLLDCRKHRRANARRYWRFSACLISLAISALVGAVVGSGQVCGAPNAGTQLWEFPDEGDQSAPDTAADVILLPPVDTLIPLPALDTADDEGTASEAREELFVARLLPPQPITPQTIENENSQQAQPPAPQRAELQVPQTPASRSIVVKRVRSPQVRLAQVPALEQLSQQERVLKALLQESLAATTGAPTDHRIDELAKTKIQAAYALADRGSLYVARKELVEVLRMISQAKDAQREASERTSALAAGLRALREAEDFAPRGTELEAELDMQTLCASHRTPIAEQTDSAKVLPSVMMDRYLRYAQLQLALSVAGEPAGSMALHALGKLHRQLGKAEPEQHHLADRRAIAFQQAALLAHNQNHLAAHELGVLLATSGHFSEAHQLLRQVAVREPNAVVLKNLARVQEQLGHSTHAVANREYAQQLSQQGATGTDNVQWVSPQQFAQTRVQTHRQAAAQMPTNSRVQPVSNQVPLPGTRQPAPPVIRR